ncbi:hypothetical protein RR46_01964 [Papilio xuthus]|uniref:Uncharacterized protein n=1 Tax=Papilio xuthus TaxID=66420 RepID=A0A194QGF4_PAPXU|nr:hypothetical protein RR46_01964 [Papilio xuthus]
MDEIKQIVENIVAKENNRNLIKGLNNIDQSSIDKAGFKTDKSTQTTKESYVLMSVSQDNDGYRYTTWKVLLDTENIFEMQRQSSKREISTQTTNENDFMNENCEYKILCNDSNESESDLKTKQFFINNFKSKKRKTIRKNNLNSSNYENNLNWRKNLCGDPNKKSYINCVTNLFSDRKSEREIFGFHDTETIILSPGNYQPNLINIPFCETPVATNIMLSKPHNRYIENYTCDENFYSVEEIKTKMFASNKTEDPNAQSMYKEVHIHVSEESLCSDNESRNKEIKHEFDNKSRKIILTKKPIKKISLEEYRKRLEEKANTSISNTYYRQNTREETTMYGYHDANAKQSN